MPDQGLVVYLIGSKRAYNNENKQAKKTKKKKKLKQSLSKNIFIILCTVEMRVIRVGLFSLTPPMGKTKAILTAAMAFAEKVSNNNNS